MVFDALTGNDAKPTREDDRQVIRPTDDEARALARSLCQDARFAALGVLDDGRPMVTRVAFAQTPDDNPMSLISDLSHHTRALRADPRCSLLVGEPKEKGDPLTHPRLTMQAEARILAEKPKDLKAHYLRAHPKAKLYLDFTDFHFVIFEPVIAHLNGGFGKAFTLTPEDLRQVKA